MDRARRPVHLQVRADQRRRIRDAAACPAKHLHAVVAQFLEESTRGAAATATALALHWREAGDRQRALEYLLLAADQAGRGWAKDEAAALYGEAVELCDDPELRRELTRKQALAWVAFQHVEDVRHRAPADLTDVT